MRALGLLGVGAGVGAFEATPILAAAAHRGGHGGADPVRGTNRRRDRRAHDLQGLGDPLGVRRDGQKVLLGLRNMGGESQAAWRAFLDDLVARKLATPELLIIDGAPGLEAALTALWPDQKSIASPFFSQSP